MKISIIAAVSKNNVIGNKNDIPWRLPAEQAFFKKTTMGCPIIMGRKTHEAIGRPLPGRRNIVITSDSDYQAGGCLVVHSLEAAIKSAGEGEIFIVGGSSIYEQALPLADKIYLTRVDLQVKGDRFFKFDASQWRLVLSQNHQKDDHNPYNYETQLWVRK